MVHTRLLVFLLIFSLFQKRERQRGREGERESVTGPAFMAPVSMSEHPMRGVEAC